MPALVMKCIYTSFVVEILLSGFKFNPLAVCTPHAPIHAVQAASFLMPMSRVHPECGDAAAAAIVTGRQG